MAAAMIPASFMWQVLSGDVARLLKGGPLIVCDQTVDGTRDESRDKSSDQGAGVSVEEAAALERALGDHPAVVARRNREVLRAIVRSRRARW